MITEQDIQRAFFAHLQEFYKYRYDYLPGSFVTQRDAIAQDGILADGVVRFTKSDGSTFLGTFEATSLDRVEEVKFQRNAVYFIWDCIAFASLASAAILLYYYHYRLEVLSRLGLAGIFGFLFLALLFTFSLWYFGMGAWRKYRYIYAIEQFKRFYADEQWVVLGQDVFPHSQDPYLQELRRQCTYQGFGLATVDEQGAVRVLVTPSRLGVYGKDRTDANWITGSTAYAELRNTWRKLPEHAGPFTALRNTVTRPINFLIFKPLQSLIKRMSGVQETEFSRFMRSFTYQKAATFLGLLLLGLFMRQAIVKQRLMSDREVDTRISFNARTKNKNYYNPEDEPGYLERDALPITYGKGVPKQYPQLRIEQPVNTKKGITPSANARPTIPSPADGIETDGVAPPVQEIDLTALRAETEEKAVPAIKSPKTYSETGIKTPEKTTTAKGVKPAKPTNDWCSRVSGTTGWLVQDNYFATSEGAELRIKELRKAKINAFSIKATCFDQEKHGYYVFLKDFFTKEESAIKYLQTVVTELKKAKLNTGRTIVRTVK